MDDQVRMLVNIPCRMDGELKSTIESLLDNASQPDLIDIFVFNQDREDDLQWKQSDFPKCVTLLNIQYEQVVNVTHCRSMGTFYAMPHHKYFLGIDSHIRFDQDWDGIMKDGLYRYPKKAVISAYPFPYTLKDGKELNPGKQMSITYCEMDLNQYFCAKIYDPPLEFAPSFVCGGYFFAPIEWVWEVGFDPYIGWTYEEPDATLRTWTHGYDIINIATMPIYHNYAHENRKDPKYGQKDIGIDGHARFRSKILGLNETFLEYKWPMGKIRSVDEFDDYYNLDTYERFGIIK